jgi:hypothetical protein
MQWEIATLYISTPQHATTRLEVIRAEKRIDLEFSFRHGKIRSWRGKDATRIRQKPQLPRRNHKCREISLLDVHKTFSAQSFQMFVENAKEVSKAITWTKLRTG